jgi:hypothetical protein
VVHVYNYFLAARFHIEYIAGSTVHTFSKQPKIPGDIASATENNEKHLFGVIFWAVRNVECTTEHLYPLLMPGQ